MKRCIEPDFAFWFLKISNKYKINSGAATSDSWQLAISSTFLEILFRLFFQKIALYSGVIDSADYEYHSFIAIFSVFWPKYKNYEIVSASGFYCLSCRPHADARRSLLASK